MSSGTAELEYFNARHMSAVLGSFTQPDPMQAGADFLNPQSWNGYAYAGGQPLVYTDPSGMNWFSGIGATISSIFSSLFGSGNDGCDPGVDFCGGTVQSGGAETTSTPGGGGLFFPSGGGSSGGGGGGGGSAYDNGDVFRATSFISNPAKTGTCSNLPAGTSPAFCAALQQGLQNALNALKRKPCGNFYGGQGPQTLDSTQYRFLDLHNPTTGAATIAPNNVFVNSQGPYMSYTPTPGQTGPFGRYWTQGQFRGFILLHELGHQLSPVTGFRPDAGSPLNQQQSQRVLNACF